MACRPDAPQTPPAIGRVNRGGGMGSSEWLGDLDSNTKSRRVNPINGLGRAEARPSSMALE